MQMAQRDGQCRRDRSADEMPLVSTSRTSSRSEDVLVGAGLWVPYDVRPCAERSESFGAPTQENAAPHARA